MKKFSLFALTILLATGMFAQEPSHHGQKLSQLQLKKLCLSATVTAVKLEMANYERWINVRKQENKPKEAADFQQTLDSLKIQLKKYQTMDAKDYVLTQPADPDFEFLPGYFHRACITTTAWVENPVGKNVILHVDGMTRSGPWYYLAGIAGNDFSILKPNTKYTVTFYTVFKRNYWTMPAAYVCVTNVSAK